MRLASRATGYILYYKDREGGEDDQKSKIERAEKPDIRERLALYVRGVLTEGNKACKRGDKRSYAPDIYTEQKLLVIRCKFREQYRARHVTDDLTGADRGEKRAFVQKRREEIVDYAYSRHVARKQEEADEGQKQGVIDLQKRLFVGKEDRKEDKRQADIVRNYAEYRQYRNREKDKVEYRALGIGALLAVIGKLQRLARDNKAAECEKNYRENERQYHYPHKFHRGNVELRVDIEVLRVAEGGQHASKICRDILEDKYRRHVLFLARCRKRNIAEGQEGEQRHVVG